MIEGISYFLILIGFFLYQHSHNQRVKFYNKRIKEIEYERDYMESSLKNIDDNVKDLPDDGTVRGHKLKMVSSIVSGTLKDIRQVRAKKNMEHTLK